ncbi:DddA-like double-stranded DNA deaminase toxin [Actinosynnema sp. CS-041913]|uniref:DddA-like double-stranded DNA deaminase toxin n=1 Tax=Actinosynnema sp. CS-041913 TaxID=3239917 RepID=UPI003D94B654
MASLGEVAARVRVACRKAAQARTALEQAEDLTQEAHDVLARALDGARHLESDATQMLSAFTRVVDGCRGYLWPLLNEAVKNAESLADRLAAEVLAYPASTTRRPAQPLQRPPVRQADPDHAPVIPPDRIEQLRRELPPPVVAGSGQKTRGYWIGADGTVQPVVSGRDDDADEADTRLRDMGMPRKSAKTGDAEIKLATRMVREGVRHATVLINNEPCVGPFGCDTLVPILLPEGSSLTVYGVTEQGEPIRKRYTGGARPWWR